MRCKHNRENQAWYHIMFQPVQPRKLHFILRHKRNHSNNAHEGGCINISNRSNGSFELVKTNLHLVDCVGLKFILEHYNCHEILL